MKQKIDHILWALIWMLPIIGYFIQYISAGADIRLLSYIDTEFSFDYVKNILDGIWVKVFSCDLKISGLLSYLVVVEVAHCLFDALVFIPRFAHNVIEKGVKTGK